MGYPDTENHPVCRVPRDGCNSLDRIGHVVQYGTKNDHIESAKRWRQVVYISVNHARLRSESTMGNPVGILPAIEQRGTFARPCRMIAKIQTVLERQQGLALADVNVERYHLAGSA